MFLFVVIPNNSGSTMVLRTLASSPEASCLKKEIWFDRPNPEIQTSDCDLEGRDVRLADRSDYVANYMPSGPARTFTEQLQDYTNPTNYDWDMIAKFWFKAWDMNKAVKIEKTPDDVLKAKAIAENIVPSKFIVSIRNPYAFCNSMKRWGCDLERALAHWIKCAKAQIDNIETLGERCYWTTYERICDNPQQFVDDVLNFVPELVSVNLNQFENQNKTDFEGIDYINSRLESHRDVMEFFGYELGTT